MIKSGRWALIAIIAAVGALGVPSSTGTLLARTGSWSSAHASRLAQVSYIYHGLSVTPPHKKKVKGKTKMSLFNQYSLQTGSSQRASIKFKDGTTLHMNQRTLAQLKSAHVTYVSSGEVFETLAPGTNHKVQTATAVAAAIGTEFDVKTSRKGSTFVVLHGALRVTNAQGEQFVKTNEESVVPPGKAPQPPQAVNASASTSWTTGMPTPKVGENVALDVNGGIVIDQSSQYTGAGQGDVWYAKHINDGRLDMGWQTASGQITNQWVKIKLDRTYTITKVLIDPASTLTEAKDPSLDLKDFEVRVSTTGSADADFTTVLKGTCAQKATLQQFVLDQPVQARYIELYAVDNYGSPDWLAVAEFEAVAIVS